MHSINLQSMIEAFSNLSEMEFTQYTSFYGTKPKTAEIEDLKKLVTQLENENVLNFNHFYFGFQIEQISSEFDLIRLGKNKTINIELKKEATEDVVIEQMERCRYYLNVLDVELLTFTFLADQNLLYKFTAEGALEQIDFTELASELISQEIDTSSNIHGLFEPTKYLVSPFNSTKKFLEGRYFLTNPQEQKKREFFKKINAGNSNFFGVKGVPGTGKTLLTYDIAKELMSKDFKVLLIFCADLNRGHYRLILKGWDIKAIKEYDSFYKELDNYDFIFIDEAQRIYLNQFTGIVQQVRNLNIKCVFSYDPQQCFTDYEFKRDIPEKIENDCKAEVFELSKKIRTNKELTAFISNLFNLRNSSSNSSIKYSNINILYFSNNNNAKKAIRQYIDEGWEVINYTPSRFNKVSYDDYQFNYNDNIHKNIGQEFDHVLGVIDGSFYYDSHGLLSSRHVAGSPGYELDKMLYQILTRARKKITLIITQTSQLYNPT